MNTKEKVKEFALSLAQAAYDKKGIDIMIYDMEGVSSLADYFMFITANNKKQAQAIADELDDKGAEEGLILKHMEGYREGGWVLLDFGDIICHIFTGEARTFYGLEQLWNDAERVEFKGV